MGGSLAPAHISGHVQSRFLAACNEHGQKSLVLGYHGTPSRNHESIFRQGFMLPGKNGVRIANGNAHGRGIYIAEKGAHYLSMSFLKGDNQMLICGVVDNTLTEVESSDADSND